MFEENIFMQRMTIPFRACDPLKRAKLSTINGIFADLSGEAFSARGMDHQYLMEQKFVFFLAKVSLHICRMPVADEEIIAATWEKGTKGSVFLREFSMYDTENKPLIFCKSQWVLVRPATRQILRPSEFDAISIRNTEKENFAQACKRLHFMGEEAIGTRTIRWSDLDGNGHVYNAIYSDIALDHLPDDLRQKELRDCQINYSHEAKLGDQLTVCRIIDGTEVFIKGVVNGQDCFLCQLTYA